jgi:hypothetical protein
MSTTREVVIREAAITGILEDIANALVRGARALGVPVLASVGHNREITLAGRPNAARVHPSQSQLQVMSRLAQLRESQQDYRRAGAQPAERTA